ncbi:MAG: ethanolamine ammonia-lyase reactivating factor EutA [Candidatus Thorarchaeota archaeon]
MEIEQKEILSVGIDIGTTTSHLIFSKISLETDPFKPSKKYNVSKRKIIYQSKIHFTPLINNNSEIDIETLSNLLIEDYKDAKIEIGDIDTGAVIITVESSKKNNAEEIVKKLALSSGKFVAASAGPNFETIIAAQGSGAVEYSKNNECYLIHCDIGGGTSKIAFINKGKIIGTLVVSIGGRLIAYDSQFTITRLETSGEFILKKLKQNLVECNNINNDLIESVSDVMSNYLLNIIKGEDIDKNLSKLIIKNYKNKRKNDSIQKISFSGGVAEYIYRITKESFGDIGKPLGEKIREKINNDPKLKLVQLNQRIRATVVGASNYTLNVSGCSTYKAKNFKLPLTNIPVIYPYLNSKMDACIIKNSINEAFQRIDLNGIENGISIVLSDIIPPKYEILKEFSIGLNNALLEMVDERTPVIIVSEGDVGNSLGCVIAREAERNNILSLDEIILKEGDFMDVGVPFEDTQVYPVIIKSLIF